MAEAATITPPEAAPAAQSDTAPQPGVVPNVALLQRKKARKRFWVGTIAGLALAGGFGVGGYVLIRNTILAALPQKPEKPRSKPAAADSTADAPFPAGTSFAPPAEQPAPPAASARPDYKVPPPQPMGDEMEPVPLMNSQRGSSATPRPKRDVRDAPMMVISSAATVHDLAAIGVVRVADTAIDIPTQRAQLAEQRRALQERLNALMSQLQAGPAAPAKMPPGLPAAPAPGAALPAVPMGKAAAPNPLSTATVKAELMPDMALTLPFGTNVQCQLLSRIATTSKGSFSCQVARDVYSPKRIVLIPAGSYIEADYEAQNVPLGVNAIAVQRPRLRTPEGVVFDLPGEVTGPLGEGGLPGHLDERWGTRLGPALVLSLMSDAAKVLVAKESNGATGNTVVIGGGTLQQGDRLATDVARRTLDIPPVFTVNQGAMVFLHFKEHVSFAGVYELQPAR
jgi:type IV secretion system protein VirB10